MTTVIINESNSSIVVPSGGFEEVNPAYQITGSNDQIALGVYAGLTVTGSAITLTQTGSISNSDSLPNSGDVVTIGGNGQTATDANDDVATFQAGTTVNELANSRVDVTGDYITANLTTADTLGLYGSGDSAFVAANGDSIDIGYTTAGGRTAAEADYVTYTATPVANPLAVYNTTFYNNLYEVSNSAVGVSGSNVNATLEGNDSIGINGSYDAVSDASDAGSAITIGGNGSAANFAQGDDYDLVNSLAGTVTLIDNSHVIVGAPTVNMGANDTLDLNGSDTAINAVAATGSDAILNFGASDRLTLSNPFANIAALLAATTYAGGNATIALDATGDTMTLDGVNQAEFTALANAGAIQFSSQYNGVFFQSNSTLAIGSNLDDYVNGSSDQISVAAGSTVTAVGSALAVNVTGASDDISLGGNGQSASDANDDIVTFAQGGELDEAADSRVDATASGISAYMTDYDTLGLYGSGDTVHGLGANLRVWIGLNGQSAAGSDIDNVSIVSGGEINVLNDSHIDVFDSQETTVNLGADDTIDATLAATALTISATGEGDVVNIDDTGLTAAAQDILSFASGGVVNMGGVAYLDQGTAGNVSGNGVTVTVGAGDILTLTGAAATVNAAEGSQVSVGGNGQSASNANDDIVTFSNGGAVTELADSRVDVTGSGVTATMTDWDTLGLYGSGDTVNGGGVNERLWIGLNGQNAAGAAIDVVNFAAGGEVNEMGGSNVGVNGNGVTANSGANDTLGIYGAADVVNVNGSGDSISIGGNGQSATPANVDAVNFLEGGTVYAGAVDEQDNSNISVIGGVQATETVTMGAGDTLSAINGPFEISATGAGDVVDVSYNINGPDQINFADGGVVNELGAIQLNRTSYLPASSANVTGNDVTVNMGNSDVLALIGAADVVNAGGPGVQVSIGGNGQSASNANDDIVTLSSGGAFTELANSRVDVTGSGVTATIVDWDTLGLYGSGDTVNGSGVNERLWIGLNGQNATGAAIDVVNFATGGEVNEMRGSNVAVNGSNVAVNMGANDALALNGSNISVFTPDGTGQDIISNFVSGDTLILDTPFQSILGSHFASVAALLSMTTYSGGNSTIHLDAAGDTVTLAGVSGGEFAGFVKAAHIKFA